MKMDTGARLCIRWRHVADSCNHFPGFLQKIEVIGRFGVTFRDPSERRPPLLQVVRPAAPVHRIGGMKIFLKPRFFARVRESDYNPGHFKALER